MSSSSLMMGSPGRMPQPVNNSTSSQMSPVQHRVPSQPTVRHTVNHPKASDSRDLASPRYVRQFRALLDHQRQVFDEERALWQIERSDLEDHISRLETSLSQAQNTNSSQTTSPIRRHGSGSSFSSLSTTSVSRQVSAGDEFWRGAGGKSDAQPTRTFSSTSEQSTGPSHRLPSISENEPPRWSEESSINGSVPWANIARPSIAEVDEGTFDGIKFKQGSRAPSVTSNVVTPQSPSPSHVSPGTLAIPSSRLAPPDGYVTEHAGHTPLERGSTNGTDGASSTISSNTATPIESKKERPPYEPHASFARPPSERSDSYFAGIIAETAEDPAMIAPLGLGDKNTSEDQGFLHQVDSRLEEAAKRDIHGSKSEQTSRESENVGDPPDDGPPLRIKRSMNFGSQLGGPKKGF